MNNLVTHKIVIIIIDIHDRAVSRLVKWPESCNANVQAWAVKENCAQWNTVKWVQPSWVRFKSSLLCQVKDGWLVKTRSVSVTCSLVRSYFQKQRTLCVNEVNYLQTHKVKKELGKKWKPMDKKWSCNRVSSIGACRVTIEGGILERSGFEGQSSHAGRQDLSETEEEFLVAFNAAVVDRLELM